ncbi:hypothetical protein ACPW08_001684 [Campylobacter jejuni]
MAISLNLMIVWLSAYSNALSTSTGSEFADAKQKAHSYNEASQYSEAIQASNFT